jgi:hypothetical protein
MAFAPEVILDEATLVAGSALLATVPWRANAGLEKKP